MSIEIERNRRDLHSNVIEENKENVALIWLDKDINDSNESIHTQTLLIKLNNFVQFYTNPQLCIDYIRTIKNEKIFLIISEILAYEVIPEIHPLLTVNSIFIFCFNDKNKHSELVKNHSKIIGIFTKEISLIESVENSINLLSKHLIEFHLFNQQKQKSIRDLSKESASFLWNQLLIDTLKQMPHTNDAKNDMQDKCSDYYRTNQIELKRIELFRNNYTPDNAIKRYTHDSFVHRLLNKGLRTEDIDLLYLFRFYIIDLCSQLEKESQKKEINTEIFTHYRGQQMSKEEFDRLQNNIGILISINGFFSTSRDINIAEGFIAGAIDTDEMKTVLFEIKIHSNFNKIIFADIDKYSQIEDEQEVSFSLGSVFKIDYIQFDSNLQFWIFEMTATDDDSKNIQEYIYSIRQEIEEISSTILFGALLFNEMGQIDKAEKYFHMLLKTLPKDHQDIPDIYDQIDNIYSEKGELNQALENYIYAYDIRISRFPNNDTHIANSLHNLDFIYKEISEYEKAMNYYKQVLTIDEINYPNDHTNKAHTMICIGLVHHINKEYDLALNYMIKAYEMYQRLLPSQHPYISSTLWNIGSVYENKFQYNCAIEYYCSALDMD